MYIEQRQVMFLDALEIRSVRSVEHEKYARYLKKSKR